MYKLVNPRYHALYSLMICIALMSSASTRATENFPRPEELKADVAFWTSVYTDVDTQSGYIHDAYKLAVVYETLELTGRRREDERLIKAAKARYRTILEGLAESPEDLDAEQQRVLALWGSNAAREQLHNAADNLRFQRGQSDRFREGLARSGEWHNHISDVLAAKNLPPELAALPHVESSFNPNAYSSVGAAGIWQFTRSTGRRYMHIDYVIDERMDPFVATDAAAQLLEHNYQLTGTWPLALTAYNHGAAGIRRASKQMGTTDIAPIVRNYKGRSFGFASRNFYVSFLAAVEVSENPERYFSTVSKKTPVDYAQVTLPDYLVVDSFSRAFNTDLDELKEHNRALLDPVWRGKKRIPQGYTMRVPRANLSATPQQLLAAIPGDERFSEQTPDLYHKVVPGDTVSEIASRYGHSIRDVVAMNGLNKRYHIRIGQVLRLPIDGTVSSAEVNTASPPEAQQASIAVAPEPPTVAAVGPTVDPVASDEPAITVGAEMTADPSDYTVADNNSIEIQATETLGHYAEWLDLRASQLRQLNGMPYGRPLVIGHRFKLDFSRVSTVDFESRRLGYQHDLQQSFFMAWQISSTRKHVIAPGESLWVLTRRQFKIPMWLLRQYNPDLDFDKLRPGTVILIPELVEA
ncbi:MAG: transglycosylase SLT domain-containing protein [Halioglobus sp.]